MSDKFKKIDDLNTSLENAFNLCITVLKNLDFQDKTQSYVDKKCEAISLKINSKLDFLRNDIISHLHLCYKSAQEQISTLAPIATANPTDLGGCISLVKKIADIYVKPYQEALEYYMELLPRIQTLISNMSNFASLPSYLPDIPNINFDKLNISIPPIGVDNVITGNTDSPEEPSPENPRRQINFRTYEDMFNQDLSLLKDGDFCFITYKIKGINANDGYRDFSKNFALYTERYIFKNNILLKDSQKTNFDSENSFIKYYENIPYSLTRSDEKTTHIYIINQEPYSLEHIQVENIKNKIKLKSVELAPILLEEVEEQYFTPNFVEIT